jgi:DNA mismatch repair ATPase MutS
VSVHLSTGVSLLTGANMGGKTVSLKMVGLLTYMAQLGLFIPAKRFQFKPVKYIFASLGDDQDINRGLSSFGAEIENVKQAIDHCETYGLILIDELARGTNPKEGYALSKALIQYFNNKKSIIFISTHFDGLVFEGIHHLQVKGLKEISEDISFENIQEHMDYRLIEVKNKTQVPKDALNISRILGLRSEVIDAAEKILEEGSERSGE